MIKAQLQFNDRQRELRESQLAMEKARLALAILLFPMSLCLIGCFGAKKKPCATARLRLRTTASLSRLRPRLHLSLRPTLLHQP